MNDLNYNDRARILPDDLKLVIENPRLALAVKIALSTGIRQAELLSILRENVGEIVPLVVKGGWIRKVYFPPGLVQEINQFMELDGKGESGYLFVANNTGCTARRKLPVSTLKLWWKQWQIKHGITPPYRWHDLRHTFITRYATACGGDPYKIALAAGHRDLRTSMRYVHPSQEQVNRELNQLYQTQGGV